MLKKKVDIGSMNKRIYVYQLRETLSTGLVPEEKYEQCFMRFGKFSEDRFGKFSEDRFGEQLQVKVTMRYAPTILTNKAKIKIDNQEYFVIGVAHEDRILTHLTCKIG